MAIATGTVPPMSTPTVEPLHTGAGPLGGASLEVRHPADAEDVAGRWLNAAQWAAEYKIESLSRNRLPHRLTRAAEARSRISLCSAGAVRRC
jgi:hypothetical protein